MLPLMKKKLLKLYNENQDGFIKLVALLYGTDEQGLKKVLIDKYKHNECYFIINGMLTSMETIVEYVVDIENKHKILMKANLV